MARRTPRSLNHSLRLGKLTAPLLRPEQITEMEPGTLVARIAHHRPLRVTVAPWYRSWRLKRRAGRAPSFSGSEAVARRTLPETDAFASPTPAATIVAIGETSHRDV